MNTRFPAVTVCLELPSCMLLSYPTSFGPEDCWSQSQFHAFLPTLFFFFFFFLKVLVLEMHLLYF